jgi:acetyl esterase/lipase
LRIHRILPIITILFIALSLFHLYAQDRESEIEPVEYVYDTIDKVELKAYVFSPRKDPLIKSQPAMVIFHGGGWSIGEPSWAFRRARHFANLGMVAVAAEYRLSNQDDITPIEAMEDARTVIRWIRNNAVMLQIDENRIAAYGWSSGAHIAASAAVFEDSLSGRAVSCVPDALILFSPAVSLVKDGWVKRLLGSRGSVESISPVEHVREGMPPTIIFQGREDTVTPLEGAQEFCDRMRTKNNRCELYVYDNVGHLFTPASEPDNGWPNPDKEVQAAAFKKADLFLKSLGFIQ